MPHRIACPQCLRIGLVRVERVIKGAAATKTYYCGACDFGWATPDSDVATPPPGVKPKDRRFGSNARRNR